MPAQNSKWLRDVTALVIAITGLRLAAIYFSKTDLFVDESQYWLWGQDIDFGYYSKPPLIAWIIRGVTEFSGQVNAFWVRLPAPIFHGATAIVLSIWARREFDAQTAVWVGAIYATLPIVAVGSFVISTDTIMVPFWALALLFHSKLLQTGMLRHALLTGAMVGLATMAKYAGAYFLLAVLLAALFVPRYRISVANSIGLVLAAAIVVLPNILWNIQNDLTTLDHTLDNVDWVRSDSSAMQLNFGSLALFILSQFVAMGPVLFLVALALFGKMPARSRGLIWFTLPIFALVSVQALLSQANANWAFAAYPAAVLLSVAWLNLRPKIWLWLSIAYGGLFSAAVLLLALFSGSVTVQGSNPFLIQLIGREATSLKIIELARKNAAPAVVAVTRDVLADLFLTGRDSDLRIYSIAPKGRPKNYYQQNFPFQSDRNSPVLFVTSAKKLMCNDVPVTPLAEIETAGTAYHRSNFQVFLLDPACHDAISN